MCSSFGEIGIVALEKNMKMWTVDDNDDEKQRTKFD